MCVRVYVPRRWRWVSAYENRRAWSILSGDGSMPGTMWEGAKAICSTWTKKKQQLHGDTCMGCDGTEGIAAQRCRAY